MKLSDASNHFFAHCESAVSLSDHTLRAYSGDLKDIEQYYGPRCRVEKINKEDLRQYIRHLRDVRNFKESSIRRRLACFKLFFRWLQQEETITSNPFDTLNERIRLPVRLPRALDRRETKLLRKEITVLGKHDSHDVICKKVAILTLLETGIRVGELTNVKCSDLSLSDKSIVIQGKGNRQRIVYLLNTHFYHALEKYFTHRQKLHILGEKLFVSSTGCELTPQRVRAFLHTITTRAGIEKRVTPHMLRHTCATQLLGGGLDIRYVQKLLGHQSISTTEIYTHVSDQGLREALMRVMGGGY